MLIPLLPRAHTFQQRFEFWRLSQPSAGSRTDRFPAAGQPRIQLRQPQNLRHPLTYPLIVCNRVNAPGDEQRLQELLRCIVESLKSLEMKPALRKVRDMIQIVQAELSRAYSAERAQCLIVVRQPTRLKLGEIVSAHMQAARYRRAYSRSPIRTRRGRRSNHAR